MTKINFAILILLITLCGGSMTFGQVVNEEEMLSDINYIRSQGRYCGRNYYPPAPPVIWNNTLELVANVHCASMYRNNYFNHRDLHGKRVGDRADKLGYDYKLIGENIAVGYDEENSVLIGWLESREHCECIMNPKFTEVGVSRVGEYWTQVFGITRKEAWDKYGRRMKR